MTKNKQKRNNNKQKSQKKKKPRKQKQPRKEQSIGSQLGALVGNGIQQFGTSVFNRIMGKGDYVLPDDMGTLTKNSLFQKSPSNTSATFGTQKSGFIFEHTEYITDIISSSVAGQFQAQTFIVNPANSTTFPWLSNMASNFEMYQVDGMIFRFESTSGNAISGTNSSLGTVMGYFAYDTLDQTLLSKSSILQYEGSVDAKSSESFLLGVECDETKLVAPRLYVGPPPTGSDAKTYNWGNLIIASSGLQSSSQNIGELWCHYRIKFFITKQMSAAASNHSYSTSVSSINSFGTSITQSGTVTATVTPSSITFTNVNVGTNYLWTYWVNAATSVTAPVTTINLTGGNFVNKFKANTNAIESVASGQNLLVTMSFIATAPQCVIVYTTGGVITGAATMDSLLTVFDNITLPVA